ncbi:hypothetical protein [Leuconostoc mesenteroides]|uniref:hypothetical protein n=1 Tax=Leuconostoc mesenteroides TaxID=1245 RepID=UPI0023619876|nr:hypothetical protein [Leuconostoc mesenteroides]
MTEPVAYISINKNGTSNVSTSVDVMADEVVPLYTAEQLHPRVKMTQAEFDEFNEYYERLNNLTAVEMLDNYFNFADMPLLLDSEKFILPIANIWEKFNPENPEETIEIVPNMKWFVRSKRASSFGNYIYLKKIESDDKVTAFNLKSVAEQFDTKEEAEKWTNPLTEAVQLPVEGE